MSKQIEFEYEGKKYTLEYTRESVKVMEKQGFSINEFVAKPMIMLDIAFEGAFLANHKNITRGIVKEIFNKMGNKVELSETLLEMIQETYNSLFKDSNEDESKNIAWKTV